MSRRKITNEEFVYKLEIVHKGEISLADGEVYIKSHGKIKFKCRKGHTWDAVPYSVANKKHGCPHCHKRFPYTIESLGNAVSDKHDGGVELIAGQEIDGAKSKYWFRHVCGYVWNTKAECVLSGKSCPKCSKRGFKVSDSVSYLYILPINGDSTFTGFGITRDIKTRINSHKRILRSNQCTIKGLYYIVKLTGQSALDLERYIKSVFVCNNSRIDGFKTESVLISSEELKLFCENYLQSIGQPYTIEAR